MSSNTYSSCSLHTMSKIALGRNAFHKRTMFNTFIWLQPIKVLSQWLYGIHSTNLLTIDLAWFRYIIAFPNLLIVPWVELTCRLMADSLQRTTIVISLENPWVWRSFTWSTWPWFTKKSSTTVRRSWCVLPIVLQFHTSQLLLFFHVKIFWFPLIC